MDDESRKIDFVVVIVVGLWYWSDDKHHFILSYEDRYYKTTALKVHPRLAENALNNDSLTFPGIKVKDSFK